MTDPSQFRTYDPASCVVFRKTTEAFGGLSNMAAGFPLRVNGVRIRTSEALYQACRFPHMPQVQELIIGEASPMTAKMRSKPYRDQSREDWMAVRTKIMRWCLRVKLAQNWRAFGALLRETGDKPIVEYSRKDGFWGAQPQEDGTLQGMNVLGRLLMELRVQVHSSDADELRHVEALPLENFLLFNRPIAAIGADTRPEPAEPVRAAPAQASLFDAPLPPQEPPPERAMEPAAMTETLAPYAQMRASGLDWLGEIPAHWEVRRIKTVLKEFDRRSGTGTEPLYSLRMLAGMVDHHKSGGKPIPPESLTHYKVVEAGDIVMNRMRAAMGLFGIAPEKGLVSPDYATFHAIGDVYRPYLVQLFKTPMMATLFRAESKGLGTGESGFLRLYTDRFDIIRIPLPPLEEQRGIVRVLDWHGGQVKRLLGAKARLIRLLNEQRQAIIHRAVTRGLDETAPLKPSSIDWLGDIPAHWEVRPISSLCTFVQTGPFGSQLPASEYVIDCVPVLNPSHYVDGKIRPDPEITVSKETATRLSRHRFKLGDLVMARRGELGRCAIIDEESIGSICGTGSLRIAPIPQLISAAFMKHTFEDSVVREQLSNASVGATMDNLNEKMIGRFRIPNPPVEEQRVILLESQRIDEQFAVAIAQIRSEIALIRDYRTRLIADVATGKLDVRALAATLPDTAPDDLAPDEDALADDMLEADESVDDDAEAAA